MVSDAARGAQGDRRHRLLETPLQVLKPLRPELAQMIVRLKQLRQRRSEPNKRYARLNHQLWTQPP